MRPIIKVKNLSKQYRLGEVRKPYLTLRESLAESLKSPFRRFRQVNEENKFWALKDVNFEIQPGEVVGIIGRNGAGKSTLLKILSRITEPTSGRVELYGRVASLLEVGTGFHGELTGRENIFLNGAILGMRRSEIEKKFDEIVEFAEIKKFIDTPVKRYSSGMYVRLAFAVAAHLEPEILIVDEVLAVGDAQFQKKCLKKMKDVGQLGRTVVFVSHDMQAMSRLCERIIWLKEGSIEKIGKTNQIVSLYLSDQMTKSSEKEWTDLLNSPGNDSVKLRRVRICNQNHQSISYVNINQSVGIEMTYEVLEDGYSFTHGFNLHNEKGVHILSSHDVKTANQGLRGKQFSKGLHRSICWIPANFLAEGMFVISVALMRYEPFEVICHEQEILTFTVLDVFDGFTARGKYVGNFPGVVRPILEWTVPEYTRKGKSSKKLSS